ncbi:MAG TPA: fatty oxidation complex subunit alpha [Bdellovibrionales bacterium]|nr:fatty oxidation complex subunit alpha [Bdellovibrionales bacterium]
MSESSAPSLFLLVEPRSLDCYDGLTQSVWVVRGALMDKVSSFKLINESKPDDQTKLWSVVFDVPGEKVNKLGRKVMDDFEKLIVELEDLGKRNAIDALLLVSGKPGNFIAGADIEMIRSVQTVQEAYNLSRAGQLLADRWEDLPFPTVAAVNGAALGGGCELTLACSAVIMSNDPAVKIGLPETMLGLVPGMGGCIRLPRKVGLAAAFDLILTGKTLNGERAAKAGLIEACLPKENFIEGVKAWTIRNLPALRDGKRLAREPKLGGMGGPVGAFMEKTPIGRAIIFKKAREGVLAKTRGHYPAPVEAIDIVQNTGGAYASRVRGGVRTKAMIREAEGFGRLAVTDVSKNLIRLFFMTESVKKSKGLAEGVQAEAVKIENAAVLGAGIMGGGIAQLFAEKNIPTRLRDLNNQALALGIQAAGKIFQKQVQRKRLTRRQYLQKMNLIAPVLDFAGFKATDLVVEAVVENMEIKLGVLRELETQISETCVIATNTSSLSVSKMQSVLSRPGRFVGMHFFNPVSKMPLIEVIRGDQTSDFAVSTVFQFSKQIGKTPIVVSDRPGFLVNRLLMPYLNEATYCLGEGAKIEDIDRVMLKFGMPMGPMELIDEVGVDVGEKVAHILHDAFGERILPGPLNSKVVKAGRLGKKNGKGFYVYEGREKRIDPVIYEILGVKPKSGALSDMEILERCILPMINEAARCLDEKVVGTAAEVDLGMIMGTGFPPFRGGLLSYADSLGLKMIIDKLKKYEQRFGARFQPNESLITKAEHGQKFYSE